MAEYTASDSVHNIKVEQTSGMIDALLWRVPNATFVSASGKMQAGLNDIFGWLGSFQEDQ